MKRSHQNRNKSAPNHRKDKVSCTSRKANRKVERKKKKERMNQKYLQRFSKIKTTPETLETTQRKDVTKMKKGLKEHAVPRKKTENAERSGPKKSALVKERGVKIQPVTEKDSARNIEPVEDAVMARERKQLAQLEKQLKMKKRTTLPKSFMDDGLDFLLDVVDSKKLYDEEEEEEREMMAASKPLKKIKESPLKNQTKKVRFHLDEEDSDQSLDDEDDEESNNFEEESDEEMDTDDNKGNIDTDEEEDAEEEADDDDDNTDTMREDIYGRLIDNKGNLISNKEKSGAYVPPAKRAALLAGSGQESAELIRLKKQMKGLLNRASESNMQGIANSVEELYMHHSRASVNQSLFVLVQEAVVSPILAPERLVAEMTMLVAILHGNVGSEVGAYFLQHVVKKYEELRHQEQYGGEHTMDNVLLLLCYLYNFKVAHHTLLFEVISQLVESFSEKDIELLLLLLKSAGFYLRRDDPESLGSQITSIQQKARELEESGVAVPSRVRFMLEVLVAVRNNNVRRVPGADIERTDRLRQLAGKFVRGGSLADSQMNIGLRDLLQADHKGRWWIVGSAWDGRLDANSVSGKAVVKGSEMSSIVGAVSQKLVHLAKKLRINSDLRRSIFYVLMSSEDYEDAFQRVLQLGLKGQQQQEIVVVAVLCCKQESSYNPFYSFLLQKLATHERRFMIAIQFHMWDMFKTMEELNSSSVKNLAALLAHLLASKALSLSVLKVLEFGVLGKAVIKFLKHVFTTLLTTAPLSDLQDIARAIAQLQKFRNLADGLRMFLVKHVKVDGEEKKKLVEVCNELSHNHQMLM